MFISDLKICLWSLELLKYRSSKTTSHLQPKLALLGKNMLSYALLNHSWVDSLFFHLLFSQKNWQGKKFLTSASMCIYLLTQPKKGQLWLPGEMVWDVCSFYWLSQIFILRLVKYLPLTSTKCFLNSETTLKTNSLVLQSFIMAI